MGDEGIFDPADMELDMVDEVGIFFQQAISFHFF